MSVEELSAAAGVLLSLGLSYVPGLHQRFAKLDAQQKRLVVLALLAGLTAGIFSLSCSPFAADFGFGLRCQPADAVTLLRALVLAAIANQTAFLISPRPAAQPAF